MRCTYSIKESTDTGIRRFSIYLLEDIAIASFDGRKRQSDQQTGFLLFL